MEIKLYSDYLEKEIIINGEIIKKELEFEGESFESYHINNGVFSTRRFWGEHYNILFETVDKKKLHLKQHIKTWQDTGKEFENYFTSKSVLIEKEDYEIYVELALIELGIYKL